MKRKEIDAVSLILGLISLATVLIWPFSILISAVGLTLSISRYKEKKSKISKANISINSIALAVSIFIGLITIYFLLPSIYPTQIIEDKSTLQPGQSLIQEFTVLKNSHYNLKFNSNKKADILILEKTENQKEYYYNNGGENTTSIQICKENISPGKYLLIIEAKDKPIEYNIQLQLYS